MKIAIAAPSDIYSTPRLIRNAAALCGAGIEVAIIATYHSLDAECRDRCLLLPPGCTLDPVRLYNGSGNLSYKYRLRKKISRLAFHLTGSVARAGSSMAYGVAEINRKLRMLRPDAVLAQQHSVVPVIEAVASELNIPFYVDVEDLLSHEPSKHRQSALQIESMCLPKATQVFAMSEACAEFLSRTYALKRPAIALHNSPNPLEIGACRARLKISEKPSIYWFGKSIGPHSCALELITANCELGAPFKVVLRGQEISSYADRLREVADKWGLGDSLSMLKPAPLEEMIILAAQHDILYGSQPPGDLFHELAIGNKIFTGLAAGLILMLQDTPAHSVIVKRIPRGTFVYDITRPNSIRDTLARIAKDIPSLAIRQKRNHQLSSDWSWQHESKRLINAVQGYV